MPYSARLEILQITKDAAFEKLYEAQREQEFAWAVRRIASRELEDAEAAKYSAMYGYGVAWKHYDQIYQKYMPQIRALNLIISSGKKDQSKKISMERRAVYRLLKKVKAELEQSIKERDKSTRECERVMAIFNDADHTHDAAHIALKSARLEHTKASAAFEAMLKNSKITKT